MKLALANLSIKLSNSRAPILCLAEYLGIGRVISGAKEVGAALGAVCIRLTAMEFHNLLRTDPLCSTANMKFLAGVLV